MKEKEQNSFFKLKRSTWRTSHFGDTAKLGRFNPQYTIIYFLPLLSYLVTHQLSGVARF